ncbi:MAG: YihY/virulence factor BrkB family protein [Nitrospirae bacterium]|nr:YihY/virulence factor BrkB family protein [Nitrospirota bacterium]
MAKQQNIYMLLSRFFSFLVSVARDFKRNQGLLLAGAIAYYTLLSIVPLSILALIVLSRFIEKGLLFHTLSTYIEMMIPGYAATLTEQVLVFLEHGKSVGSFVLLAMLFFSSIAFTVLESAMSVIFFHRVRTQRRHYLLSAIIPYIYIFVFGLGILLVSFIAGAIETHSGRQLVIFGWGLSLEGPSFFALYLMGILGEVLLVTSFYLIMPAVRITFRHALMGGTIATVLWELTRRVLVWYYSVLSTVTVIYGSFATSVVALLSLEAIAVIILLGAQIIAELERRKT